MRIARQFDRALLSGADTEEELESCSTGETVDSVEELESRWASARSQLHDLIAELDSHKEEVVRLRAQLSSTQVQLQELQQNPPCSGQSNDDLERLATQLRESHSTVATLRRELLKTQNDLHTARLEHAQLLNARTTSSLAELRSQLSSAKDEWQRQVVDIPVAPSEAIPLSPIPAPFSATAVAQTPPHASVLRSSSATLAASDGAAAASSPLSPGRMSAALQSRLQAVRRTPR